MARVNFGRMPKTLLIWDDGTIETYKPAGRKKRDSGYVGQQLVMCTGNGRRAVFTVVAVANSAMGPGPYIYRQSMEM